MGFELTTLTITGLQVWYWSNCAKQACVDSFRFSDSYKVMLHCPKSEVVHETKFSLKISYWTHACLAQLDQYQTCNPVMVSVVSSNSTGGKFIFLRHLNANFVQKWQKCQICVIYENFDCNIAIKFEQVESDLFVNGRVAEWTRHRVHKQSGCESDVHYCHIILSKVWTTYYSQRVNVVPDAHRIHRRLDGVPSAIG